MRIISLKIIPNQLTLSPENEKFFEFKQGANIIYSDGNNSVGKTTLLRFLMYALGYPIPNTRGIRFASYETILTVSNGTNEHFEITRNKDYIELLNNGEEKGFSLPVEQNELHSIIYGISNFEVVDNLFGSFYFDQEKGWTLLNRGKAIGSIHFSLEALLRGLSEKTNDELTQRLYAVRREIKKYKHMLDVAAYNAEINKLGEVAFIESPAEVIENALDALYSERKPISEELGRIKNVIRKNTNFEKYITSFGLMVQTPDGEKIPVNKDTLIGYTDTADLLIAKQKIIFEQLATIDRKIDTLKNQQDEDLTLAKVKSSVQQFDLEIAKITVDTLATQRIVDKLNKERKHLEDNLIKDVKRNNPIVAELHDMISKYAIKLGLDERHFSAKNDYIFTSDLKTQSGAKFHLVVFAFRISYVKLIHKYTGVALPIILDSPSGREVSLANIAEMMDILDNDFSEHQIIIASIHDGYALTNKYIIEIKDRLLPF